MRRIPNLVAALVLCVGIGTAYGQVPASLSVQGDRFAINGKGKFLLFASYFDAMHASSPAADFTYLKGLGFDGIRIFPAWSRIQTSLVPCGPVVSQPVFYLAGTEGNPASYLIPESHENWTRFIGILTAARDLGLVVDVTLDASTREAQMAVPVVAERLKGQFRNVLLDVYNEYDIRGADETTVARLVQAVHDRDPGRITTASGLNPGTFAKAHHLDTVGYHDPRTVGAWWTDSAIQMDLNTIRGNLAPGVKPIYYQEPMPFENVAGCPVSVVENGRQVAKGNQQHDSTPTDHRNAAKFAKKWGAAAWTFHSRQSFSLAGTTLVQALTSKNPAEKAELESIPGSVAQICDSPGPGCRNDYWHVASLMR